MNSDRWPVTILRSRRRKRTISIEVRGGGVLVRAPSNLAGAEIDRLLAARCAWIERRMEENRRAGATHPFTFLEGEAMPFLGRDYELRYADLPGPKITLTGGDMRVCCPAGERRRGGAAQRLIHEWYRDRARQGFAHAAKRFAPMVGVRPRSLKVGDFRSQWGSCSTRGDIALNWRLAAGSASIIDYVVVHELCHIVEPNHSERFWSLVSRHIPDWRERKKVLRREGARYMLL